MSKRSLVLVLTCFALARPLVGQPHIGQSIIDRFFNKAEPIGTARMTFPGPNGGFTFLHLPVREVKEWGDTVVTERAFLLDLNISNDGVYLSPDTVLTV